jgi:hypothetical protein
MNPMAVIPFPKGFALSNTADRKKRSNYKDPIDTMKSHFDDGNEVRIRQEI